MNRSVDEVKNYKKQIESFGAEVLVKVLSEIYFKKRVISFVNGRK